MPEGALDDLVKFTTVARFEPHRVIFSKGDAGDCLYGILSGRVRIYSNSAEGAEIMLNVLEQGDLFGEIALLDGSTRTASAAAMEQADLLRIHRAHFLPYVKANPDLILAMLTLLCQRLRWTSSVIEDAAFLAFPARLAKRLLVLAERHRRARARARGYGTFVAARPRQHGRRRPRNNQQATRPLALFRDRRYRTRRHCHPQLRSASGVGRLRLIPRWWLLMTGTVSRDHRRLGERRAIGVEWRQKVPLGAHAEWTPPTNRTDPLDILLAQGRERIPELLPVRYARMKTDPFAFLRGAAAVMAADLAANPTTGLRVQSCGDCHLANFGSYATPEGTPVFDVNDFDETLPAPFEWDVKRLAASLVVSGRVAAMPDRDCRRLARIAAKSYREQLSDLARLAPLDAWNMRIDLVGTVANINSPKIRRNLRKRLAKVLAAGKEHFGLVEMTGGHWRIKDKPPLVRHLSRHELHAHKAFASYAETLQEDRRVLLQRYHLRDIAFKVVGVGSVGTFCAIGLFVSDDDAPLLLQIKEAQQSVLAPFAGPSDYPNHGQRIVVGQRMLQAATDVFLGWTQSAVDGRYFYVRRLKDQRLADIGARLEAALPFYAGLCGRTLARAHARSGDAVSLSGYIGDSTEFDKAIAEFARAYADQTEQDWRAFLQAIAIGRIAAEPHAAGQPP